VFHGVGRVPEHRGEAAVRGRPREGAQRDWRREQVAAAASLHLLLLLEPELLELRDAEAALRDLFGLDLPGGPRHAGRRGAGAAVLGQLLVVLATALFLDHLFESLVVNPERNETGRRESRTNTNQRHHKVRKWLRS
jgi:hypothetical protein